MKTTLISLAIGMITMSTNADDIQAKLAGGGFDGTFPVTTNETSCGRLHWDGPPDKTGGMSGGQCEITVQRVDDSVVVNERTRAFFEGIGSDVTAKTIIPITKIPWSGTVSQTTVTVFRVAGKLEGEKSPGKVPKDAP